MNHWTLSPSEPTKQTPLRRSFQSIVRGSKLRTRRCGSRSLPAIRTGRFMHQSVAVWRWPWTEERRAASNSSPPLPPRTRGSGPRHPTAPVRGPPRAATPPGAPPPRGPGRPPAPASGLPGPPPPPPPPPPLVDGLRRPPRQRLGEHLVGELRLGESVRVTRAHQPVRPRLYRPPRPAPMALC